MSKSRRGQSIQGPLLIKIETFPKSGRNKRCFADCNEKCPRKSYTIFDPKPPRRRSKTKDEHSQESAENIQSFITLLSTTQKEENFQPLLKTSTVSSTHSQQEPNLSDYEKLSAGESEQPFHINISKNLKDSEIVLTKNKEENMPQSSRTPYEEYRNSDQRISEMPPNGLMTPEAKNSIIQYCKPNLEMEKHCLCSDVSKGQKRTATDIMNIPKKLLRPCNKNGIKFCNKKLDQETNPDYTIEISVELAQNKKKKGSQIEPKKKQEGIVESNETDNTDGNYDKSPRFPTNLDQNDNYIDEKSKYPDPSKHQRVDYPTRIAKISDRRTLTTRQPNAMNQPEEISISVNTSRVEISTDEGKQTLLKNKRTTTIRSSYSEWDADGPAEQPQALMDSYDRASIRSSGQKSIPSQRKPIDPQHSGYNSDQENESPQYMQYKEDEVGRDESPDKLQKKVVTQNEQLPTKSPRDSAAKSIGAKQIEGTLYKRTTKMRTDGDMNQPDKFSVISEVEEGELYLPPESRKKTLMSEADPYMTKLFETEPGTTKPSRHLSLELDEVMDPDQWSFDEQDIVEKRRHLFERARALSAGLLERARTLSAATKSERENEAIAPTTKRDTDLAERYQDHIPPAIEMEQQSRGTYRPLQSAPPSTERRTYEKSGMPSTYEETKPFSIRRNIAVSTFSPPISLASFVEKSRHGTKDGRSVVSSHSERYSTPGTVEEDIQSRGRHALLQSPPSSTPRAGYPASEEPSYIGEDDRSRDKYPPGSIAHSEGYPSSNVPSRAGSRDRYPGDSSVQPDGYPTSGLSSRAGSRDRYPAGSVIQPGGYQTSELPSRAGSRDTYPGGSLAHPDGYQSNVPSRAGSRDTYPGGSSAHPDGYQSNVPSRAGSRDRYPGDSSAHPDGYRTSEFPSRAGSKDTYPGGSSVHPDGYQSNAPSRAGSRDRYPGGSSAYPEGYQSNVPSRAGSRDRYPGDSSAHPDEYQRSGVPSRAGSKDTYPGSSYAHPDGYHSNVPSRAGSKDRYPGGSEVPSRAGSRDTFTTGSLAHPDGYRTSEGPSRAGSRDRYPAGSIGQPDGYRTSEVSSRAGPREPNFEESREPSSIYPSIRSGVGSSTTIDKSSRRLSDGIAAPQLHLPFRDFGASTASPMSFDSYVERGRRSRISSPAVSLQPITQREPDISSTVETDYESQGSHRPTGSVFVTDELEEYPESEKTQSYAKEDETKPAIFQPKATIVPLKDYPKSGCFLELCVLEKHVDGCMNKRKIGDADKFCGYDVLSRQIFQTCQDSTVPLMLEEEVMGKSTVGSLQSGRKKPDSLPSERTAAEEIISETRATPVYSEKKSVPATESTEEEMGKRSETESYVPSEVTSVDTYAKEDEDERLKREAEAKAKEEERLRKEALRKEEEEERLKRAALRKEEEEERLKRAALAKKEEEERPRRTSSATKSSMGGSDKEKSDVISDTDTMVSSVTSKKSSFSGHIPDFRNMPVQPAPIDRKPTSMFSKWFKSKIGK
ncbi:hypothetical protein WA026_001727 [Henosepilachna vigintioctopunctata]|uniref:Uncharacterized protein n=1 Tax=Henosepilachna vigintioctopunctata TaxID=420089 RepID=A0AAW1USN7_9CUCU